MTDTGLSLFHEGYRIGGATKPQRFIKSGSVASFTGRDKKGGEKDAPSNVWREAKDWPPRGGRALYFLHDDAKLVSMSSSVAQAPRATRTIPASR